MNRCVQSPKQFVAVVDLKLLCVVVGKCRTGRTNLPAGYFRVFFFGGGGKALLLFRLKASDDDCVHNVLNGTTPR